jgi:3-hydroxyisobutyrate dehydrogenase-like beta-hydroxyacid dehydrogenase
VVSRARTAGAANVGFLRDLYQLASNGDGTAEAVGALVIDFSSIRPDVSAALAADGAKRGFRVLDAPVSGGEQGAIEGVLSALAELPPAVREQFRLGAQR